MIENVLIPNEDLVHLIIAKTEPSTVSSFDSILFYVFFTDLLNFARL